MFKTACLNYEPTPFLYRDRVFTFDEIHQIKFELMHKCTEIMTTDNVFKTLELHPKRIYDDSVLARDIKVKEIERAQEKADKVHKLSVSTSVINNKQQITDQMKRGLIKKFLGVKTPQVNNYRTITDPASENEDDSYSRMPKLTNLPKSTSIVQNYVYDTRETNDVSIRLSQTRVILHEIIKYTLL